MDFGWNAEQEELRSAVVELAKAELNQGLRERDLRGEFNREGWNQLARFGVHGLPIPTEYGGQGLDPLTTVGVLDALGYGCQDNGLVLSINAHMWTAAIPILDFGTDEQKRRWLPGLCDGSLIGGNAMSEPESGSDAYALATRAEKKGDRFLLNGQKVFITNGPVADVLVVFANEAPERGPNGISAFLVERDFPGFSFTENKEKMGNRTSPMAELFFDDCEVPETSRLGNPGAGKALFAHSLTWERSCILATAVGAMERLLELSTKHARQRKQFGAPIGKNQLVATKIVDMKLRLETARALLYKTAWLRGQGKSVFLEAALTKLHVSESWVQSAQDAIQIHGGYGYMRGYDVERELRDAIGSRLYSGTSEIQRTIAAALLGL